MGFSGGTSKEPAWQNRRLKEREMQIPSMDLEDPLEEGTATTPVFLPGESYGQRSLVGYGP